jgi:hypothetical protein
MAGRDVAAAGQDATAAGRAEAPAAGRAEAPTAEADRATSRGAGARVLLDCFPISLMQPRPLFWWQFGEDLEQQF